VLIEIVMQRLYLRLLLLATICIVFLLTMASGPSAGAIAPVLQVDFQTPTPGPDGKIIYIVKEGDSLWTIAALSGISVEELRALNGIQPNDFISPGMELLLGLGGPELPTAIPDDATTATPIPLTPTPLVNTGEICVLLFLDENGNARLDEGEIALANGQLSVADVQGVVAGELTTDTNLEGACFTALPAGDYNVSAAVPPEHNPTTSMNIPVRLQPGEIKNVEFGAQPSAALVDSSADTAGGQSTLLGLLGGILLIAAGALGYYASRMNRNVPKSLR
jgi:hypothetical protein